MNIAEFLLAVLFYLVFFGFGFIGLPLTVRLFENKLVAYIAAKLFGLIIFGYGIWLAASLHFLSYQSKGIIFFLWILAIVIGIYLCRHFFSVQPAVFKKILLIEGLTFVIYFIYLFLRSHNPDINGTESFMDMAFLSSAGKTDYFPFIDPWFAGKTVNYYYYGSYLMSLISNIGKIPYALAYNLALGLIYAQSFLLAGLLGYLLTRSKVLAATAAFLVTTAGTLFFAGCTIQAYMANPVQVCSFASSTRLFTPSYIINEIPSYSFTVGDLHAHFLALPFFLFVLLLYFYMPSLKQFRWLWTIAFCLSVATVALINIWDGISLICLIGILLLLRWWFESKDLSLKDRLKWLIDLLLLGAGAVSAMALLMLPAILTFKSPIMGIGWIPAYVKTFDLHNVQWPTPLIAQAGMWGLMLLGIFWGFFNKRKEIKNQAFVLASLVLALGILIGIEFLFVRDIYSVANPPYFRANTTFKFGYHAWTLLVIVFVFSVKLLFGPGEFKPMTLKKILASLLFIVVVMAGSIFPYQAIKQYYSGPSKGLGGSEWMAESNSDDWEAINYINNNLSGRKVIAEAVGDSYTSYARISTFTGSVAPMGWKSHEWTWRLDAKSAKKAIPGQQTETGWSNISAIDNEIKTLYETTDPEKAKQIIRKYGIEYVYIGSLERSIYPALNADKFSSFANSVFTSNGSTLYAVNK